MYTAMSVMHNFHENGERMLPIPKNMVGCVFGKDGQTLEYIKLTTNTDITFDDIQTRFVIKGTPVNQYNATLDIKKTVARHKRKNMDLKCKWFPLIDIKDGIFELQPSPDPRLCLKCETEDHHNDTGNLQLILQELPKILNHNVENNRKSNVWCHFGKIYIKNPIEENKEYSLSEVEKHVIPRHYFAPNEEKWDFKFSPGFMLDENELSILHTKWFPAKYQTCPFYKRCEITFYTPSCNELRLKIFIIADIRRSNSVHTIYKSSKCPHEIHSVIKSSDSPPYFYICESTPKTGLVDIFEPAAEVDIRLITEAIRGDFNSCEEELLNEASILYDYVKRHLKITDKGEVDLPREDCPKDFDYNFIRASVRETFTLNNQGMVFTAQISYAISYNATSGQLSNEYWDIHLSADDCNDIKPEEVCDKVPKFLRMAKEIARALSNYDQSNTMKYNFTVPSEILERGDQAQKAYQTALKSGKVKNCPLPIVVVGQARSGKTSLLRSLHGEKFDPFEDSTIGAKLQRSSSVIEDSDWMKNETDEHMAYDQFTAIEIVKLLMTQPLTDSTDPNEDSSDVEFNNYNIDSPNTSSEYKLQSEHSTLQDKAEGYYLETFPVEKNVSEKIVMSNVKTRKDFQSQASFNQHKNPPEEVVRYATNLLEHPETAKRMENCLYLNVMDFAGQPVYSVIHPVFIPPKGIFLLVHNLENELDSQATPMVKHGAVEEKTDDHCPLTNINHLEFWLSLVVANSTIEGLPPVFVVCTHADKLSSEDAKRTAKKILGRLTRENYTPGNHIITDIYTVDNTVSGSGGPDDPAVERLKKAISNIAKSLPQFDEDIPIRWLEFEKRLLSFVNEDRKKYISHEDAKTTAVECNVDIQSDELGTLLNYLHDLKVIIYFQEIDIIIIDTQWLMDMFSKVITVPSIECHGKHKKEWKTLEMKGIVEVKFLEHLWKDLLTPDTPVQSLITIMEKFSLLCKQRDGSLLVPGMLLSAPECNELMSIKEIACPLIIRFKSSHLPFGLFPRLLVAVDKMCHRKWPESPQLHLSKNFARCYTDDVFSFVFKSDIQTIAVVLVNEDNPGCRDDTFLQLCDFLLNFLRETLPQMMESFPWMKTLEYEFGIHCPICIQDNRPCEKHTKVGCVRGTCAHFISEEDLLKKKPRCEENSTKLANAIPSAHFSHWFKKQDEQLPTTLNKAPKNALPLPQSKRTAEDEVCKEIVEAGCQNLSMTSSEANQLAKTIAFRLKLDKSHMKDPPKIMIAKCRRSCKVLMAEGAKVFVEALRDELPSGMTGPLNFDHGTLVKDMDYKAKEQLSEELTVEKMKWKAFAKEKVGLTSSKISLYDDRAFNPVLKILNEECGDWSVENLYYAIADSGAGAIADRYL